MLLCLPQHFGHERDVSVLQTQKSGSLGRPQDGGVSPNTLCFRQIFESNPMKYTLTTCFFRFYKVRSCFKTV